MFYGYVYCLTDGEPVVVLCKNEHEVERSIARLSFATDEDSAAFITSLSLIKPGEML